MFFINHTEIGEGSTAIIEVDGPLNSDTTPDFDDYLNNLVDKGIIYLLVDMLNLRFISSEGIGAVLMIQKAITDRNGLAVFFNMNYEISSLFRLLGFDKVFTIASDRADALNILDRHMELFPPGTAPRKPEVTDDNEDFFFNDQTPETESPIEEPDFTEPDAFDMPDSFDFDERGGPSFESFVIECVKCRSLIRINEPGEQLCPFCSAEFTVDHGKKAVFKMRDVH